MLINMENELNITWENLKQCYMKVTRMLPV